MRHFRKRPSWRRVKKAWYGKPRLLYAIKTLHEAIVTLKPLTFNAASAAKYANNWKHDWPGVSGDDPLVPPTMYNVNLGKLKENG